MEKQPDELRTEHWCAGLQLDDARPLTPGERAVLGRCVAHETQRLALAAVAMVLAAAGTAATLLTPEPTSHAGWVWARGGILVVLAVVVPAVLALVVRDCWRERERLRQDLEHGEWLRFTGQLDEGEVIDDEQASLLACGVLKNEPGATQRLEVLPVSGRVLVRHQGTVRFETVTISEVAAMPEYALRVTVPREIAWLENAPDAEIVRRTLNDSERGELEVHVRFLRWPSHWVLVSLLGLVAWAGILLILPRETADYARRRWPLIVLQGAALVAALFEYVRALRLARQLARDVETGWAFMIAERDSARVTETPAPAGTPNEPPAGVPRGRIEFLPNSRAVWNQQGKPARWRNLRRAA
jgi:hypothetical protein